MQDNHSNVIPSRPGVPGRPPAGSGGPDFVIVDAPHVDLGLPSGTLWASRNVGAAGICDVGAFFAWGETAPKNWFDNDNYFEPDWPVFSRTRYGLCPSFNKLGFSVIGTSADAAMAQMGREWRMPSILQFQELAREADIVDFTLDGVPGHAVVGPNRNALFFPHAGYMEEGGTRDDDEGCFLWTGELFPCEWPDHTVDAAAFQMPRDDLDWFDSLPAPAGLVVPDYVKDDSIFFIRPLMRETGCPVRAVFAGGKPGRHQEVP